MKLVAGNSNRPLAEAIAAYLNTSLAKCIVRRFADMDPDAVVVNVYVDNDIPLEGGDRSSGGFAILRLLQNAKLGDCAYDWIEAYDLEPKYREMACKAEINPWLLPRAKGAGDNQQYYDRIADRFERDPKTKESLLAIRDLFPGPDGSSPSGFTPFRGEVYFAADDGVRGNELWKTDGTAAGTRLVVNLDSSSGSVSGLHVALDRLFFKALRGEHGWQPFVLR